MQWPATPANFGALTFWDALGMSGCLMIVIAMATALLVRVRRPVDRGVFVRLLNRVHHQRGQLFVTPRGLRRRAWPVGMARERIGKAARERVRACRIFQRDANAR